MGIKSDLGDFKDRVHLDEISKSARDLESTTDALLFVRRMVSLSALLDRFDRDAGNSFPAIDENAQDPTYFIAAYFDTKSIADALWVYRVVRSLTRYVLLSDRFYETGEDKYELSAKQALGSLTGFLRSEGNAQHLTYSVDYLLGQFSEFWKFEKIVKCRMLEGHTFSYAEIRHFIMSKSSDALLVYSKVLGAKIPNFNENVALVLHCNQALLDIQDDWEDIEEDIRDDMPNIFVMATLDSIPYSKIKKSRHDVRKVVLSAGPSGPISRLLDDLHRSIKSVSIPENFAFLKILSDRYVETVKSYLQ
jgi:hypothetical protein